MLVGKSMVSRKKTQMVCTYKTPPTTDLHGPIFNHVTGKEQIAVYLKDNLFKLYMKKLYCTLKFHGEQAQCCNNSVINAQRGREREMRWEWNVAERSSCKRNLFIVLDGRQIALWGASCCGDMKTNACPQKNKKKESATSRQPNIWGLIKGFSRLKQDHFHKTESALWGQPGFHSADTQCAFFNLKVKLIS